MFPKDWPDRQSRWNALSLPGVSFTVGVHPNTVTSEPVPDLLSGVTRLAHSGIASGRVVGIGEAGIDFYHQLLPSWDDHLELQQQALQGQISLAERLNLPLVIHCRGESTDGRQAWLECLEFLRKYASRSQVIHRHCFTGGLSEMTQWQRSFDCCYFGFAGKAALLGRGVDPQIIQVAQSLPGYQILVETDAPYLPTPRGRNGSSSPWMVGHVAEVIASWRGEELEGFSRRATANLRLCYALE